MNALPALLADHARLVDEVADLRDDIAAGEQGRAYLRSLVEEAQRGQRKAEAEVARLTADRDSYANSDFERQLDAERAEVARLRGLVDWHRSQHCLDCEGPLEPCQCQPDCPGGQCARKCHTIRKEAAGE